VAGLVHLDHAVDLAHEPKAGKESDASCKEEEADDHDAGVSEVEEGGSRPLDVQLGDKVVNAVDRQVKRRESWGQETAPPPMIILGTEVEIAEENGGLRTGYHQDQEHQKQETIHVVDLRRPDWVEYKEELDENAAEGQDSAHDDARDRLGVHALVRDLSGNLICPHRLLDAGFPEPEVCPYKSERDTDPEPESQQRHEGEEGNGGRAAVVPQNQIHNEEVSKHYSGAEHWS